MSKSRKIVNWEKQPSIPTYVLALVSLYYSFKGTFNESQMWTVVNHLTFVAVIMLIIIMGMGREIAKKTIDQHPNYSAYDNIAICSFILWVFLSMSQHSPGLNYKNLEEFSILVGVIFWGGVQTIALSYFNKDE